MGARKRYGWIAVGLVVLLAGATGFGLWHGFGPLPVTVSGPPVTTDAPTTRPSTADGPACWTAVDDWDSGWPAVFRVGVDAGPRTVTAIWWPTLNDADCRIRSVTGDAAVAGVLATDIRRAPPVPSGRYNCPMAVGGAVDLYFGYGGGRWERVRVHPTGCASVTARHRQPRQFSMSADLAAIAPPGQWQQILR
jgi:hypothetical protein